MQTTQSDVLARIVAETAEWIADDLISRAAFDPERATRYRSAALVMRARARRYETQADWDDSFSRAG